MPSFWAGNVRENRNDPIRDEMEKELSKQKAEALESMRVVENETKIFFIAILVPKDTILSSTSLYNISLLSSLLLFDTFHSVFSKGLFLFLK